MGLLNDRSCALEKLMLESESPSSSVCPMVVPVLSPKKASVPASSCSACWACWASRAFKLATCLFKSRFSRCSAARRVELETPLLLGAYIVTGEAHVFCLNASNNDRPQKGFPLLSAHTQGTAV